MDKQLDDVVAYIMGLWEMKRIGDMVRRKK